MRLPWWGYGIAALTGIGATLAARRARGAGRTPAVLGGPTPTIRLGSSGEPVARWRAFLGLPAGDRFDEPTATATRAWQSAHGLVADGIVGPKTWGAAGFKQATGTAPALGQVAETNVVHFDTGPAVSEEPFQAPPGGSDSGRAWANALPKNATADRGAAILAAVGAGFWRRPDRVAVQADKGGRSVVIYTWGDCLAIGLSDPVRVNLSHADAQRLADRLGMVVGTSRMCDAAYAAAPAKLFPQTTPADAGMATTARMIVHSDKVSTARNKLLGQPFGGYARDNGKDWVTTERLLTPGGTPAPPSHSSIGAGGGSVPAGANFGWHADSAGLRSPGGFAVFQSIGLAHDMNYSDYSQCVTLYDAVCEIDGAERSVVEVLRSPELAWLLSDDVTQGHACRVWRHPAVPEAA
jgi:hypothetical protein